MYLHYTFQTLPMVWSNNRDETFGNMNTLHKVNGPDGKEYTIISADAQRHAIRKAMAEKLNLDLNTGETPSGIQVYKIPKKEVSINGGFKWEENKTITKDNYKSYYDTVFFGFMDVMDNKNPVCIRSCFQTAPAVSATTFAANIMNNFAAPVKKIKSDKKGDKKAKNTQKADEEKNSSPAPFSCEMHYTSYRGFGTVNIGQFFTEYEGSLENKIDIIHVFMKALLNLKDVGGVHTRFYNPFYYEKILFEVTDKPFPTYGYDLPDLGDEHYKPAEKQYYMVKPRRHLDETQGFVNEILEFCESWFGRMKE